MAHGVCLVLGGRGGDADCRQCPIPRKHTERPNHLHRRNRDFVPDRHRRLGVMIPVRAARHQPGRLTAQAAARLAPESKPRNRPLQLIVGQAFSHDGHPAVDRLDEHRPPTDRPVVMGVADPSTLACAVRRCAWCGQDLLRLRPTQLSGNRPHERLERRARFIGVSHTPVASQRTVNVPARVGGNFVPVRPGIQHIAHGPYFARAAIEHDRTSAPGVELVDSFLEPLFDELLNN